MNLSLQDPFAVAKEYPETLMNVLQYGHSTIIQFNHKGDYLASGLSDGSIIIYDMMTSGGVIAHLHRGGHIRAVTSLSWSHCGRYLLSSSQDWTCKLWDLSKVNQTYTDPKHNAVIRNVKFDGPVWSAVMHPRNQYVFVASLLEDSPAFVDISDENEVKIQKLGTSPYIPKELDDNTNDEEEQKEQETLSEAKKKEKHMTLVCAFTPNLGAYIFTGTSKGWLNIIDTRTLKMVRSIKIANANIKNVVVSPNGRKLAVNCSDRIIRQIDLPDMINVSNPSQWDFEIEHKYQDMVNRLQWNAVAFNYNAEFLIASTYGQSSHDLYMWETAMGTLIKILEGSNEELVDVKWNYPRCTIGSTGLDSGTVYIWSVQFPQKWSALAPDFAEIEENIEYEEKEDEFDVIGEDALIKKRLEEEDLVVDIISKEPVDARGFDISQESFIIPISYEKGVFED